jgi:hypothetical protein
LAVTGKYGEVEDETRNQQRNRLTGDSRSVSLQR